MNSFSLRVLMDVIRLNLLFAITAVAEIGGCYLSWLVVKQGKSLMLLFNSLTSHAHEIVSTQTNTAYKIVGRRILRLFAINRR